MSANISTKRQLLGNLGDKEYRDSFVEAHLSTNVAAQIFSMREHRGWTQGQLAENTGMKQARISVLENPNYDKFSVRTLRRLASAFDVALVVRFVPFSQLIDWVVDLSPEDLTVRSFDEDSFDMEAMPSTVLAEFKPKPQQAPTTDILFQSANQPASESALRPMGIAFVVMKGRHDPSQRSDMTIPWGR